MKVKHLVTLFRLAVASTVFMILLLMRMLPTEPISPWQFTIETVLPANSNRTALQLSNFKLYMVERSLRKKGYTLANIPPWSALWTDKVHLCVMFNLNGIGPKKGVTDLLVSYYYPFFRNITFIFDGTNWEKPDFLPEFVGLLSCDSHQGWYQHKCIRSCIHQGNEETKGYLYISDDMFINLTMMADLPATKLWFIDIIQKSYSWILSPGTKGWWWDPPFYNAEKLEHIINVMPKEWMEQLKSTAGFPDHFKVMGASDIIYVPQGLVPNLTTAIDFVINTNVDLFSEITTPLVVNIAAPQFIALEYGYIWENKGNIAVLEKKINSAQFAHPIKLGKEQERELWIRCMEEQLYSILHAD